MSTLKTPYHIGIKGGVGIVCTEEERKIIEWATQQFDKYNVSNAPKWACMPDYHFKEAKEAYDRNQKLNKKW